MISEQKQMVRRNYQLVNIWTLSEHNQLGGIQRISFKLNFSLNWVSSLLLDAFRHFIRVQFKNSCSYDGRGSQNFEDFSFNQSWIASVIGVGDEISDLKVEIPKRLETSIGPSISFIASEGKCQPAATW